MGSDEANIINHWSRIGPLGWNNDVWFHGSIDVANAGHQGFWFGDIADSIVLIDSLGHSSSNTSSDEFREGLHE